VSVTPEKLMLVPTAGAVMSAPAPPAPSPAFALLPPVFSKKPFV